MVIGVTKANRRKQSEEDILNLVAANVSAENEALYHRRATWFENALFIRGVQYARYNFGLGRVVSQPDNDARRVHVIFNITRRVVEAFKALYLASSPKRSVIPMGDDETIIEATEFANDLLEWRDQFHNVEEMTTDLVSYLVEYGTAFMHVGWDPNGGRTLLLSDGTEAQEGDPFMQVVDPQEISFHPHARSFYDSDYVRQTSMESKEWAETFFPEAYDKLSRLTAYASGVNTSFQRALTNLTTTHGRYASSSQGTVEEESAYWVKQQFWKRPCPKYPDGLYIIAACVTERPEIILHAGPNPYRNGAGKGIPFAQFKMLSGPGIAWGETIIPDLKAPQREINRRHGQIMEWANILANSKMFVSNMVNEDQVEGQNGPGAVVYFPEGASPAYFAQPPELHSSIITSMQESMNKFNYISSPVGPSSEEQSSQARSAVQLNLMMEERNRVISPMLRSYELSWNRVDRMYLDNFACFQKTPRGIGVARKDGSYRAQEFHSLMRLDQVQVQIVPGSMLPQSATALAALAIEYTKAGLLDPINDPELKGQLLDSLFRSTPNDRRFFRGIKADWEKARRNLSKIRRGSIQEVAPDFMDNATVHRAVYEEWMKTEEYGEWRKENPDADQFLRQLVVVFAGIEQQNMLAMQAQAGKVAGAEGDGSTWNGPQDQSAQGSHGPEGVAASAKAVRPGSPSGGNRTATQGFSKVPAASAGNGE